MITLNKCWSVSWVNWDGAEEYLGSVYAKDKHTAWMKACIMWPDRVRHPFLRVQKEGK